MGVNSQKLVNGLSNNATNYSFVQIKQQVIKTDCLQPFAAHLVRFVITDALILDFCQF